MYVCICVARPKKRTMQKTGLLMLCKVAAACRPWRLADSATQIEPWTVRFRTEFWETERLSLFFLYSSPIVPVTWHEKTIKEKHYWPLHWVAIFLLWLIPWLQLSSTPFFSPYWLNVLQNNTEVQAGFFSALSWNTQEPQKRWVTQLSGKGCVSHFHSTGNLQ